LRIFHGVVNVAGIGGHLAAYQRSVGHDARFYVFFPNPFFDNHDQVIYSGSGEGLLLRLYRRLVFCCSVLNKYDVFTFYFGQTLLPYSIDLPVLRLLGKRVVMVYCGSDARLASIERQRNVFWGMFERELLGTQDSPKNDWRKKIMLRFQGWLCHRIIAPRNLYASVTSCVGVRKVVKSIWVHNLSAAQLISNSATEGQQKAYSENSVLRLVHIPSSPLLKGTSFFRAAIEQLKNEGLEFEYIELTGLTHAQAWAELSRADIVLDQLLIGGFGSLSVEGMGLGKPVVCFLIDSVMREHYPDCPIVNANIENVTDCLRRLLLDPEWRQQCAMDGRNFFGRHFDYVEVNERLLSLYGEVIDSRVD
jgi:glycosyltransferase involved in cell wall biosynthesis